jgi:hypothetical protein
VEAQIGTVEMFRPRVFQHPSGVEVVVDPGVFSVLVDGWEVFWVMWGVENQRGWENLGEGALLFRPNDGAKSGGALLTQRSNRFKVVDFYSYLSTDDDCQPGDRRLYRFDLESWAREALAEAVETARRMEGGLSVSSHSTLSRLQAEARGQHTGPTQADYAAARSFERRIPHPNS